MKTFWTTLGVLGTLAVEAGTAANAVQAQAVQVQASGTPLRLQLAAAVPARASGTPLKLQAVAASVPVAVPVTIAAAVPAGRDCTDGGCISGVVIFPGDPIDARVLELSSTMLALLNQPGDDSVSSDSIWISARMAMMRQEFRQAAALFGIYVARYSRSPQVPQALYFQSFSLYRMGDMKSLQSARATLNGLLKRYPTSRPAADARVLHTRVCGELVQRGDQSCATELLAIADDQPRRPGMLPGECDDSNTEIQIAAVNAVVRMDPDKAASLLRKAMERRDQCSLRLRRQAVLMITQRDINEMRPLAYDVLRNDPDGPIKDQIASWLVPRVVADAPSVTDIEKLYDLLGATSNRGFRTGLIDGVAAQNNDDAYRKLLELSRLGGSTRLRIDASNALLQRYGHRIPPVELTRMTTQGLSPETSQLAANVVRARGGEFSTTELIRVYETMPSPEVRPWVMDLLAKRTDDASLVQMVKIANQGRSPKDRVVGPGPAQFLMARCAAAPPTALRAVYDSLSNPDVRNVMLDTFGPRAADETVAKWLIHVATTEKAEPLRMKAGSFAVNTNISAPDVISVYKAKGLEDRRLFDVVRVQGGNWSPNELETIYDATDNPAVRGHIINVLGERNDDPAFAKLIAIAKRTPAEKDTVQQQSAPMAIYIVRYSAAQPSPAVVTTYESVSDKMVRAKLIELLGTRRDDAEATKGLLRIAKIETTPKLRDDAACRLAAQQSMDFSPAALVRLNTDQTLKGSALGALIKCRGAAIPSQDLVKMYGAIHDRDARLGILNSLGDRDDDDALDMLVDVAKADKDLGLRERALTLIKEMRGDRARRRPQ